MKDLKPFFCYFGGKWRAAKRYPLPKHKTLVEPFAGAAGYSLRHHHLDVHLYDIDPVICGVWDYLINAKPSEIMKLPATVSHVDECDIPQEAKWLIGFWLNKGSVSPRLTPSSWMRSGKRPNSYWGETIRERIAQQVSEIKHWSIMEDSYKNVGMNGKGITWFVDPPYQAECGGLYKHNLVDYEHLRKWCLKREGQCIVCEQSGADWLPFEPFVTIKATPGKRGKSYSKEVIWQNN